jgi:ClpP class serine protease
MTHEIRRRILRQATPEEKERHRTIRAEIRQELPELKQWARETAARHPERVAVGTVFTDQEAVVLEAIDQYATEHSLVSRGAVVREALAHLLGIDIPRQ